MYIQPQEQVGQIVKEYLMARQQDPNGCFLADIPAAVRLQAPLKGCPAGSVLLWAAGERSSDMLQAAMPDDWIGHPQRKDYPLGGIPVEYKGAVIPPPDTRRDYN